MARQAIGGGLPFPVYVNETGTRQAIGGGVYVDETIAASGSLPTGKQTYELATRGAPNAQKAGGEAQSRNAPLLTPNPAQPFAQTDWPRPQGPGKVQASDAPADITPNFYPNPTRPFGLRLWESPTPAKPPLKSDVYWGSFPLYAPNPGQPFPQSLWEGAAKSWPKAGGEVQSGDAPLLTPNPIRPFRQGDWFQIGVVRKAQVDDVVNLLPIHTGVVVVASPFYQTDWLGAAALKPKITDISLAALSPLYRPNPARPFVQNDWLDAVTPRLKIVDTSASGAAPLYTPNPALPFGQSDWTLIPARSKAKVDEFANLLPVQTVAAPAPFAQADWLLASAARAKASVDVAPPNSPLYNPNPARPFHQDAWDATAHIFGRLPLKSDIFVNLLPLQSAPIVVGSPFSQSDWPLPSVPGQQDRSWSFVWPQLAPPPAPPHVVGWPGRRIRLEEFERRLKEQRDNTFGRRRWAELKALEAAEEAASRLALETESKARRKALKAAAQAARDAARQIEQANSVPIAQVDALTLALDAAVSAVKVKASLDQAKLAVELAKAVIAALRQIEDENDEDEAVMLLLMQL